MIQLPIPEQRRTGNEKSTAERNLHVCVLVTMSKIVSDLEAHQRHDGMLFSHRDE